MNFNDEMKKRVTEIRSIIEKYLPQEEGVQKSLLEAMNFSMLVGGKMLRPLLMQQTYVKGDKESVEKHVAEVAKQLGGKIAVKAFWRYEKGEGIQKKEEDYAAEVAKLANGGK